MKIYATHKMSGMISKSLEQPAEAQPYFDTTEFQDILSDMIFRALDGEDILKECEGHDFLTDLMVDVVEHAKGDESPEVKACVAKKIPILMDEGYQQKQAIAIAFSMCKKDPSVAEKAKEVPKQDKGKMTDEDLRQMGRDRLASIDGTKIPSISNTREVNLSVTEDQGLAATFLPSYTRSIASPGREVKEIEEADQISKDGTSGGAKLGWETRQRGSSPAEPAAPAKYVDPLSDPNATISQLNAAAVDTRRRIRELKHWKLTPDQKFKISLSEKRLNAIMAKIGEKRGAEKAQEGDTENPFASAAPVDKVGTSEGVARAWETRLGKKPPVEEEEPQPKPGAYAEMRPSDYTVDPEIAERFGKPEEKPSEKPREKPMTRDELIEHLLRKYKKGYAEEEDARRGKSPEKPKEESKPMTREELIEQIKQKFKKEPGKESKQEKPQKKEEPAAEKKPEEKKPFKSGVEEMIAQIAQEVVGRPMPQAEPPPPPPKQDAGSAFDIDIGDVSNIPPPNLDQAFGLNWQKRFAEDAAARQAKAEAEAKEAEESKKAKAWNRAMTVAQRSGDQEAIDHLRANMPRNIKRKKGTVEWYTLRHIDGEMLKGAGAKTLVDKVLEILNNGISKAGTSEGAKKGWETRRRGGAVGSDANRKFGKLADSSHHVGVVGHRIRRGLYAGSLPSSGDMDEYAEAVDQAFDAAIAMVPDDEAEITDLKVDGIDVHAGKRKVGELKRKVSEKASARDIQELMWDIEHKVRDYCGGVMDWAREKYKIE